MAPALCSVSIDPNALWTVTELDNKLEDLQEEQPESQAAVATPKSSEANEDSFVSEDPAMDASFMSESIYQKMSSPKSIKQRSISTVLSTCLPAGGSADTPFRKAIYADSARALCARIADQGDARA